MRILKACILLWSSIPLLECTANDTISNSKCNNFNATYNRTLKISIRSKRDKSGEWLTEFFSLRNSSVISNDTQLDMTHRIIECQGTQIISIHGVARDLTAEKRKEKISFHKKCSKNSAITNDGQTIQKFNLDLYGVGITNRPLRENEIFRVRLDKKTTRHNHAVGIGITTHAPTDIDIPNHIFELKIGTWMLYHSHVYQNGVIIIRDYIKLNLNDLMVGNDVGVMKSKHNTLHFYINGVDQGPAASNIDAQVYGVFELFGNAIQGTIMD